MITKKKEMKKNGACTEKLKGSVMVRLSRPPCDEPHNAYIYIYAEICEIREFQVPLTRTGVEDAVPQNPILHLSERLGHEARENAQKSY